MVGDSEQYASAMALMARSLGLPSRVVLGFLPKDDEGEISESRTEEQGTTTITKFTGQRRDRMGGNQTGRLRLGGILSNAKGNQSPRRKPEPHPTESANPGTPAPGTTHPTRYATTPRPKASPQSAEAWPTKPQPTCSGSISAEIARKVAIYGSPLWTLPHHMRSPARHQSDRTGTIKKTRQHAAACGQPAGNRSPRSHGKADSTFEAHAANRRFRSRIRWIFPARPCSLWARKPITRPSPVISSTKSMCSSIGAILRRNASTCSSHCRRYARWRAKTFACRRFPFSRQTRWTCTAIRKSPRIG